MLILTHQCFIISATHPLSTGATHSLSWHCCQHAIYHPMGSHTQPQLALLSACHIPPNGEPHTASVGTAVSMPYTTQWGATHSLSWHCCQHAIYHPMGSHTQPQLALLSACHIPPNGEPHTASVGTAVSMPYTTQWGATHSLSWHCCQHAIYRTRALLSAYAFISTGRKWAPMLETQLNNE